MAHDLFSSLALFESLSSPALMVREPAGDDRPAACNEILQAAQRVLARRVKGADPLGSPAEVRNFLRARLGALPHEVFAVVHLDARRAVVDCVEMFRGTLTQTSVYPREVVKEALRLNSGALLLVHCHPSGSVEPTRADELLTHTLKQAPQLVDVRVLDHLIVADHTILSMAEKGRM